MLFSVSPGIGGSDILIMHVIDLEFFLTYIRTNKDGSIQSFVNLKESAGKADQFPNGLAVINKYPDGLVSFNFAYT